MHPGYNADICFFLVLGSIYLLIFIYVIGSKKSSSAQVGGIEWFQKETRGMKALKSPAWKDPTKTVGVLRNLYVREYDKSLPADYPGLHTLGLRGRPKPIMIPAACSHLSLTYQVAPPFLPLFMAMHLRKKNYKRELNASRRCCTCLREVVHVGVDVVADGIAFHASTRSG